jgi:hypothetical protein
VTIVPEAGPHAILLLCMPRLERVSCCEEQSDARQYTHQSTPILMLHKCYANCKQGIGGYLCFIRVVSMFPIPAVFVLTLEQVVAEDILRERDGPQPQVAAEGRACASILQWWTRDGLFRMSCQYRIRPSLYTCQYMGMHVCRDARRIC